MINVLALIIFYVFTALQWAIIIRALLSWLPMAGIEIDPDNPIIQFLRSITDPIIEPLRPYTTIGMMDISPIVAYFLLGIIKSLLLSVLGASSSGGIL
jgi:YggT family protein